MRTSEQINEVVAAVSRLQSSSKGAEKGSVNPHFKNRYSSLEDIWASIRDMLGAHGLSVFQELTTKQDCVSVLTLIAHSSGQWIEFGPLEVPFSKRDAQAVGSACSYAKRYSLCAALGIVSSSDDDDGNGASHEKEEASFCISEKQVSFIKNIAASSKEAEDRLSSALKYYKIDDISQLDRKHFDVVLKGVQTAKEGAK